MKIIEGTIHANPGKVLDCATLVRVECGSETAELRFPALERDDDSIGPMVYVCLRGTELHVVLCNREDEDDDFDFAWNENNGKWRNIETAK